MTKSFYFFTVSIIFIIVAILHFLRLMFEWNVQIGSWSIPSWISGIIIIIAIFITYWSFKIRKEEQSEKEEC